MEFIPSSKCKVEALFFGHLEKLAVSVPLWFKFIF